MGRLTQPQGSESRMTGPLSLPEWWLSSHSSPGLRGWKALSPSPSLSALRPRFSASRVSTHSGLQPLLMRKATAPSQFLQPRPTARHKVPPNVPTFLSRGRIQGYAHVHTCTRTYRLCEAIRSAHRLPSGRTTLSQEHQSQESCPSPPHPEGSGGQPPTYCTSPSLWTACSAAHLGWTGCHPCLLFPTSGPVGKEQGQVYTGEVGIQVP